MNKTFTARQLLAENTTQVATGYLLGVDADIPLEGAMLDKVVEVLNQDTLIMGLDVLISEGKSLGTIPLDNLFNYIETQIELPDLGGNVGTLEGNIVSEIPKYQCNQHNPPYLRLVAIARSDPPKCPICDEFMEYIG